MDTVTTGYYLKKTKRLTFDRLNYIRFLLSLK